MKTTIEKSEYDIQAEKFLADNGIKFRATLSDSKAPAWQDEKSGKSGHHYRVTLSKSFPKGNNQPFDLFLNGKCVDTVFYSIGAMVTPDEVLKSYVGHDGGNADSCRRSKRDAKRITFDFWGSISDAEKGIKTVSAYDVLACISSDANCADNFKDFCSDFGYDQDSIKGLQTFRRCSLFAKRLKAFFTSNEIEQLQEIN
jgi:hypothetical protein